MLIFLKIMLLPISVIYGFITWVRNILYNIGVWQVHTSPLQTIGVGNITIGGTGKTPMVEFLVHHFAKQKNIAVLSRGYGRKTRGFIQVNHQSSANDVGDEPLQIFNKWKGTIPVFVCEDRVAGISKIKENTPHIDLVILDDIFQHRAVKPKINILLCDFHRPFYKDWILPTGLLRETRWSAKRADLVVVTKCPPLLSEHNKIKIRKEMRKYLKSSAPIFFSYIKYSTPVSFEKNEQIPKDKNIFLVTGIANPDPLTQYIQSSYTITGHLAYNDHRNYTTADIKHIVKRINIQENPNTVLLTTEKDFVKLNNPEFVSLFDKIPLYYISVEASILESQPDFTNLLEDSLSI
jgi:tetraacyldisaccharide 4'-kinase